MGNSSDIYRGKKKKPEKEKTREIAQEFCKKRSIRY